MVGTLDDLPEFEASGLFATGDLFSNLSTADEILSDLPTLNDFLGPEEKIGPEAERRGSITDVGEWMLAELKNSGTLSQSQAAHGIVQHFGGGFIYRNRNGNYAIDPEALKHFRMLTEKTVVWIKSERFWRWRQEDDPPGKREI